MREVTGGGGLNELKNVMIDRYLAGEKYIYEISLFMHLILNPSNNATILFSLIDIFFWIPAMQTTEK
jgi:hypothetical protein